MKSWRLWPSETGAARAPHRIIARKASAPSSALDLSLGKRWANGALTGKRIPALEISLQRRLENLWKSLAEPRLHGTPGRSLCGNRIDRLEEENRVLEVVVTTLRR